MAETGFPPEEDRVAEMAKTMWDIHGLYVSAFDESFLYKALAKRLDARPGEGARGYLERLAVDQVEAEALYRSLLVTYSEFFRDPLVFALLEQRILPQLMDEKEKSGRTELRVWSAGCAAGQEAWSVAVLLDRLAAQRDPPPKYRIFATDQSEPDLATARSGLYDTAALGNIRLRHLEECFTREGGMYAIAPGIRSQVDFSFYDLLDSDTTCPPCSIFGDFDLVLCRNVLLYYRPDGRRRILEKLRRGLAPGGYLVTGETERWVVESLGGFHAVAPAINVFKRD